MIHVTSPSVGWLFGVCVLAMSAIQACVIHAQDATIKQQIYPIECSEVSTQAGAGNVTTTDCDDLPVPAVTSIMINGGRPILRGFYFSAQTAMLRININNRWYTSGVDSVLRLTANGWVLDLSQLSSPLAEGDYIVILSVTTNDGLVIQDSGAAVISVVAGQVDSPAGPSTGGDRSSRRLPAVLRRLQEIFATPPLSIAEESPSTLPSTESPRSDMSSPDKQDEPSDAAVPRAGNWLMLPIALLAIAGGVAAIIWRRRQ